MIHDSRDTCPILQDGDRILAQLFNGELVTGKICVSGILTTTTGLKVKMIAGQVLHTLDISQVQGVEVDSLSETAKRLASIEAFALSV